ncbi:hypothetical protein [Devosia sp.]|uniref:hypothetical protein n=1 Tax=Devosia sp. TaxID=1871048 RepID=UPI003BACA43D
MTEVHFLQGEVLGRSLVEWQEKVRQALQQLEVRGGPRLDDKHLLVFGLGSDLAFERRGDATEALRSLETAIGLTGQLSVELGSLPPSVLERLDEHLGIIVGEFDERGQARLAVNGRQTYRDLMQTVKAELQAERDRVTQERNEYWSGSGKSPHMEARLIAVQVAEIYVELRPGKTPSIGKNSYEPTTPFTRAVSAVFKLLGVEVSFRSPCAYAIEELKRRQGPSTEAGA